MIASGIACASACQMTAQIFDEASVVHAIVGAGQSGFSQDFSGNSIAIGRYMPALAGASGLRKNFSA